ncbi:MAG: hypothetical protein ACKO34_05940 [Vampirovibrionales bacterium]
MVLPLTLQPDPFPNNSYTRSTYKKYYRPKLREAYHDICAYTGYSLAGRHGELEHFKCVKFYPHLQQQWDNFLWAEWKVNRTKKTKELPLHPKYIELGWFHLVLDLGEVEVGDACPKEQRPAVQDCINKLGLNDPTLITLRLDFWNNYQTEEMSLQFLEQKFPYIYYEAQRQGRL